MNISINHNNFSLSIKIKTKERFIKEAIEFLAVTNPPWIIKTNVLPDITLHLKSLSKKNTFFLGGNSRIIDSQINRNGAFLIWAPSTGSFIKTDFRKRISKGEFVPQDPNIITILRRWINLCILMNYSIKLHSASIRIAKERTLLLVGGANSGKTTLSAILKRNFSYKIINDDLSFLVPQKEKIYLFSINFMFFDNSGYLFNKEIDSVKTTFYGFPRWIFFLKRKKGKNGSKIVSMPSKEAFKKICFYSEFPLKEGNEKQQRRLEILSSLIKQCRCFYLISKEDIKDNPLKLKHLLFPILSKN